MGAIATSQAQPVQPDPRVVARRMLLVGRSIADVTKATNLSEGSAIGIRTWLGGKAGKKWAQGDAEMHPDWQTTLPQAPTSPEPPSETRTPNRAADRRTAFVADDARTSSPESGDERPTFSLQQVDTPNGPTYVAVPVQGTGSGRSGIRGYLTPLTLGYYDRENADYLSEMRRRGTPADQMPPEYPNGLPGWLEDVVVRFYQMVLHKRLAWVDEDVEALRGQGQ